MIEQCNTIIQGDALEVLKTLPDGIVQTVITSPPYYGLRDYGTAQWTGGSAECDHEAARLRSRFMRGKVSEKQLSNHGSDGDERQYAIECPSCGATRIDQQIGLEDTPEAYIARLVEVFREVKRVLRDDGTLWVNIGDSYAGAGDRRDGKGNEHGQIKAWKTPDKEIGLKPKDLIGIPWLLAFALRADGWYLRSDIIWAKSNCMPESVTDRPTKSHEYIFLLSKAERYYYNAESIKEPATCAGNIISLGEKSFSKGQAAGARVNPSGNGLEDIYTVPNSRNKRSVWTVNTSPFSEAHFATFPPKLIEPCILAGSRPGDIVLDPFSGAGTALMVASQLGRSWLGIELNPEYIALARERMSVLQVNLWEAVS